MDQRLEVSRALLGQIQWGGVTFEPTGCCPRAEELLVKYGDRELCDSCLRICQKLEDFYEYEWSQRWYGTDFEKKGELLSLLNDICAAINDLEPKN